MSALTLALILAVTPLTAMAAPPDVMTIVKQMKEIYEPSRPSTRQVIITTDGAGGEKTQWIAGQAIKKLPDGKRSLMVILSPESLKGNAFLIQEREGKPSVMWMYLPALRRIRELVPVDVYQHFLDTDFTYADLGFVRLEATYRLLGEEQHAGVRAYKVEETIPQDRAY
ncbi:MAG: outer membrane lipoprotein-sorting protein [Deltaproteobacteria bacterium]|nr:outer membrane lipoprotein-sorting protein [Deltaproteobacteria bacterium]